MSCKNTEESLYQGTESGPSTIDKYAINHNIEESVKSGESKFKIFTFDTLLQNDHDSQKCIDFWKFLESSNLKPARGFNLKPDDCKTESEQELIESKSGELDWNRALHFLQSRNLHKLCMHSKEAGCRFCKHDRRFFEYEMDDSFDLASLNVWDPQKKKLADFIMQTDKIYTSNKFTQTSFKTEEEILKNKLKISYKGLDDLLAELLDKYKVGKDVCICEEECVCVYDRSVQIQKIDKCTCSCGETDCLCTQYTQIVEKMLMANDSFEMLSTFEIDNCPCSETSCACLEDYELLLKAKMEVKNVLEAIEPGTKLGGVRCECSCQQMNCPCGILLKLYQEIDQIMMMGDTCRCSDSTCTCLEFQKILQSKLLTIEDAGEEEKEENKCNCSSNSLSIKMQESVCICKGSILNPNKYNFDQSIEGQSLNKKISHKHILFNTNIERCDIDLEPIANCNASECKSDECIITTTTCTCANTKCTPQQNLELKSLRSSILKTMTEWHESRENRLCLCKHSPSMAVMVGDVVGQRSDKDDDDDAALDATGAALNISFTRLVHVDELEKL